VVEVSATMGLTYFLARIKYRGNRELVWSTSTNAELAHVVYVGLWPVQFTADLACVLVWPVMVNIFNGQKLKIEDMVRRA
jgi:hypothetical protein